MPTRRSSITRTVKASAVAAAERYTSDEQRQVAEETIADVEASGLWPRAYQVSVVATIFVPLTFVTGFFGMNFGWMVDHIDSPLAFWLLGMAVPIATAALLWRLLVRRFLVGEDRSAGRR